MKSMILLMAVFVLSGCIVQPMQPYYGYGYDRYQRPPYYPHRSYQTDQDQDEDGMQGMHTPEEYDQPTNLKPPLHN